MGSWILHVCVTNTKMTQEDFLEGNKSLAEFMQLVPKSEKKGDVFISGKVERNGIFNIFSEDADVEFINKAFGKDEPVYHESWDLLMPVFEKIENVSEMSPSLNFGCGVTIHTTGAEEDAIRLWAESSIETNLIVAWKAAVKYVEYYHEVIRTRKVLIEKA